MPVQIGGKPDSDFSDPIGMLADCHRRIERFLATLAAVAKARSGNPLNAEEREALKTALQYFRDSAPKHTADEEDSLFPRMRIYGASETDKALAPLISLESDHIRAHELHEEIDQLGSQWLAQNELSPTASSRLTALLEELAAIYQRHIRLEEDQVFPLAARLLDRQALNELGREMAARRSVPYGNSVPGN